MSAKDSGAHCPSGEQTRPLGLDLELKTQKLHIRWADGQTSVFPLERLRRECPCATCRTNREKQSRDVLPILSQSQTQAGQARVISGQLVGNYAIQLDWSDGHNTGIFDFRLLRGLHEAGE